MLRLPVVATRRGEWGSEHGLDLAPAALRSSDGARSCTFLLLLLCCCVSHLGSTVRVGDPFRPWGATGGLLDGLTGRVSRGGGRASWRRWLVVEPLLRGLLGDGEREPDVIPGGSSGAGVEHAGLDFGCDGGL